MQFVRKLCPLALVLLALPAEAGNLVGTWVGRFSCNIEETTGKRKFREPNSTVQISQPGGPGTSPLRVDIDGELYTGSIVPSPSDPTAEGAGAFVACTTSNTESFGAFSEIELIAWKVKPNGDGKIGKSGVFVTNGLNIGFCTGSWERVSTLDPGIPACP